MVRVGVLAVQGDFIEHSHALKRVGVESVEVRLPEQLDSVDGLIIPGGESTTIVQLIDIYKFRDSLRAKSSEGFPIWGTCAGMIVMASELTDKRPDPLKLMDIVVTRNAFGRQVDSFEADIDVSGINDGPFRAVFIRAPIVTKVGKKVKILAELDNGNAVAVQQNNLLATAFHPELTNDSRMHLLFAKMIEDST
ncbi:MAG: pyridoxal 5'-phosphate synthase glutaminase subunit PdxT [Dehalococcoidia bacterium]|nr:pyridoxal 5'-phosphate synthase glutaminase subunit PdxT [Dehalococcoidia bacterium]MQG16567.1 pyridoxal 5'-phosphate synthase glutaminase subunit PdxT [SAR202 cluster bacterium]|tara:strand:+ start:1717 stop:2298 length:582 start_codon:yes stop_codon:yes gene_type:complete